MVDKRKAALTEDEKIGWAFPGYVGGTQVGLRNSGIETFKEHILLSFAKEACQNSLDARKDNNKPVIVELNKFYISKEKFLGYEEFLEVIEKLIDYWSKTKNDKSAEEFFKNAKKLISQNKIPCIRISDFNTTGLEGSDNKDDEFTNWCLLVKSEGASDKPVTAGGSYGIGKFASFASSRIRTVFYSTRDLNGVRAYQGVARLASWKNDSRETTVGTGYYGNKEYLSSIAKNLELDDNFKRDVAGTDIYILGFEDRDSDWEEQIIASVIDHFMLALMNNNLIFKLGGWILNKANLKDYIEEYKKEKYVGLLNENTLDYYYILTHDDEITEFKYTFREKDDINLKVIIKEGFKNKVAILRNNGMKIFDKAHLPNIANFSGVLRLVGNEANSFFKKLENPQHDGWEPDRLTEGKENAKKEMNKLFDFIRESIRKLVESTNPENMDAIGISEYLPDDPEDEGDLNKEETIEGDILETDIKTPKVKADSIIVIDKESGGKPGKRKNKTKGGDKGSEPSESGNGLKRRVIPMKKLRVFSDKENNYILKFSIAEARPELNLYLRISGETINEDANIIFAKRKYKGSNADEELKFDGNRILLRSIDADEEVIIEFKLKEKGKWSMEADLNEDIN